MDEELLSEFLLESKDNLDSIEQHLLDLETNPDNPEMIDAIFRVIHTVKGSCGFLGLGRLEKVAHAGENLLGKIRSLRFPVDADIVSLLLENVDAIKQLLDGLEIAGQEPELDHSALCKRLAVAERLIDAMSSAGTAPVDPAATQVVEATPEETPAEETTPTQTPAWMKAIDAPVAQALQDAGFNQAQQVVDAGFETIKNLPGMNAMLAIKLMPLAKAEAALSKATPIAETVEIVDEKIEETTSEIVKPAVSEAPKPRPAAASTVKADAPARASTADNTIRVDVSLLDDLMNQVGELVLSRNRLLRLVEDTESQDLLRVSRGISQITTRLQEQLLQTRMQPISTIWGVVPRMIRDISKQLGKKIQLVMIGQETELDRTILAALKDPLTHIIRNSCDHGVEMPEKRRAAGKHEEGKVTLRAHQESGFIIINIIDDGGGIDPDRIRTKAVTMNLLSAEQAQALSDKAALQLIFHPGLSTAETVSSISGRGVGMDVVRSEIEKVGGTVEITSELGKGSQLHIRIPLTLAIIPAMIVISENQRFAVPQMLVQELLSVDEKDMGWEDIAGSRFFRLRGQLLPIMGLDDALRLRHDTAQHPGAIVVIEVGETRFGIGVDEVLGAEEIVVKPVGLHFRHLDIYGGCSILGDGGVVPILDCNGLAHFMSITDAADAVGIRDHDEAPKQMQEGQYVLLFSEGTNQYAIPMALIERLEEINISMIEQSGSREVLQYREEIIPVLRWQKMIGQTMDAACQDFIGLIVSDSGRRICLLVEGINDIVQDPLHIKLTSDAPLFIGTVAIHGVSTEVIDAFEILKQIDPNWFTNARRKEQQSRRQRILFVEDAAFFRNLVMPVLDGLGFEVWTANNGRQAQQILEEQTPDLILTDLEMPEMNGFELASWVRSQRRFDDLPLVVMSSIDDKDCQEKLEALGIHDRLTKFDRKTLVTRLQGLMNRDQVIDIDAEVISHGKR